MLSETARRPICAACRPVVAVRNVRFSDIGQPSARQTLRVPAENAGNFRRATPRSPEFINNFKADPFRSGDLRQVEARRAPAPRGPRRGGHGTPHGFCDGSAKTAAAVASGALKSPKQLE